MDIWTVLEYSMTVTAVGLLIWLIKLIFHDKLDARWHYLIWLVLLVRLLVPVGFGSIPAPLSVFQEIPIGRWMEAGRLLAEENGLGGLFRLLGRIYVWGAAALGIFYLAMWAVLRVQMATAPRADGALREYVDGIAAKYGLKSCRDIRVRKSGTPYICGLVRPVLVIPADREWPKEPVIVHELLHRKHWDVLINIAVHAVRVCNWFNPFLWIFTAAVLNDSEALCDQRVLERCGGDGSAYGELLIAMGEGRGGLPAKIGTSNMASSYRNMKTRIRRIRDFRRVPRGIGLVTLCITLILAVAGIGSAAEETCRLRLPEVESLEELEKELLYARCCHARTPQEAIYIFLRSWEERNVVPRMAVMPEAEIPGYERFAERWFLGEDVEGAGYFPQETGVMERYQIYNLVYDEMAGSAIVCAMPPQERGGFAVWRLELDNEDGWKVWLAQEAAESSGIYDPEPLLYGSARLGDFLVELSGYSEGRFHGLEPRWSRVSPYQGGEEGEETPLGFDEEYRYRCVYVAYQGEEPLEGHEIKILTRDAGGEDSSQIPERPWEMAGEEPGEGLDGTVAESYSYGDSKGNGSVMFDGAELMAGGSRLVYGVGDGSGGRQGPCWKEGDRTGMRVWIYIDGILAEEGEVYGEFLEKAYDALE